MHVHVHVGSVLCHCSTMRPAGMQGHQPAAQAGCHCWNNTASLPQAARAEGRTGSQNRSACHTARNRHKVQAWQCQSALGFGLCCRQHPSVVGVSLDSWDFPAWLKYPPELWSIAEWSSDIGKRKVSFNLVPKWPCDGEELKWGAEKQDRNKWLSMHRPGMRLHQPLASWPKFVNWSQNLVLIPSRGAQATELWAQELPVPTRPGTTMKNPRKMQQEGAGNRGSSAARRQLWEGAGHRQDWEVSYEDKGKGQDGGQQPKRRSKEAIRREEDGCLWASLKPLVLWLHSIHRRPALQDKAFGSHRSQIQL